MSRHLTTPVSITLKREDLEVIKKIKQAGLLPQGTNGQAQSLSKYVQEKLNEDFKDFYPTHNWELIKKNNRGELYGTNS